MVAFNPRSMDQSLETIVRKDVTSESSEINRILDRAEVLHLALIDAQGVFCVPVNFARKGSTLYVHSGRGGRKAAALQKGTAGLSAIATMTPKTGEKACQWGYRFESVRASAACRELTTPEERAVALQAIVQKHAGQDLPIDETVQSKTALFALELTEVTARIKR